MDFRKHSELEGKHAALSASKPAWLNYSEERLADYIDNSIYAAIIGTKKHNYAKMAIELRQKQPDTTQTLNYYINTCIGYGMTPEVVLCYNPLWAFGTADAISFKGNTLRIFDLKTGVNKTDHRQLKIYAAYYCLEYGKDPLSIEYDLRIYQNDDVEFIEVFPEEILEIMNITKESVKFITDRLIEEV